jgi:hypothetical protein
MNELIFEVLQESDGGFVAECLTENIFTQADNFILFKLILRISNKLLLY